MPAAIATTSPFDRDLAFWLTSALASSISSRTRSDAFSEISVTVWPIFCGSLRRSGSGARYAPPGWVSGVVAISWSAS